MDDNIIIIGFIGLFVFILIYFSLKKTDEEKAIIREEKRKRLEKENQKKLEEHLRLEALRKAKEAQRIAQLQKDRERNEELIRKGKLIVNNIGKAVNDSTNKLRKKLSSSVNKHYLTSFTWVMVTASSDYILFTFKNNNQLIITKNGNVEKGSYEIVEQNKSIIITRNGSSKHFNFINLNNDYFFLNKISTHEVFGFLNQNKINDEKKEWFLKEAKRVKMELQKK